MSIGHNNPPMPSGWIATHRSIRNHHIVGFGKPVKPCDPSRGSYSRNEAWIDLIMECRYRDGTVMNGGHEMELRRGELIGAISWLAARWNWTPKTVRGFIDALVADGAISVRAPGSIEGKQKGKQANVITVCNYEKYQSQPSEEGQAELHAKGTQRASNGQATGNIRIRDNQGKQEDSPPSARTRERSPEEIAEANRIAREAYEAGQRIKGGAVAKSGRAEQKAQGELDGGQGLLIDKTGRLTFVNGVGAQLADQLRSEFPGINIQALANRAAKDIVKGGYPTLMTAMAELRRHAQFMEEDAAKAAERSKPSQPKTLAAKMRALREQREGN